MKLFELVVTGTATQVPEQPPRKAAKTAGLLYLIFMVTFACSQFIQSKPIISGNAIATGRNIIAFQWLFRTGFIMELLSAVFFLLSAWALFVVLKSINKNLSILFLLLNLAGVAIECVSALSHFAALMLFSSPEYFKAFSTDQRQALAMFFLDLNGSGEMISALFYGVWLFPLGYLVFKSGFLPKFIGILLIADGFSVVISFFQSFLFPGYEKLLYPLYPVMFIAELSLALWLLIKGVKIKENR
jgi:hypothetical protein